MSSLERALAAVHDALVELSVPYMVIGGLANAIWGVARATLDVDLTVWVEEPGLDATVAELSRRFACAVAEPIGFVRSTRVLPLSVEGTKVDVVFGQLPYEREAIARAVARDVLGRPVRFCTAEDLILHKIISDRPRDLEDVRGVLRVQKGKLDLSYLEPRLRELAMFLERPSIWDEVAHWL